MHTSDRTRHRRLLDLLAGWSDYTARGAVDLLGPGADEISAEADAIADLYQRMGRIETFTHQDYDEAMREIANIVRTGGTSYEERAAEDAQRAKEDEGADECNVRVWDPALGMAGAWGVCKYTMGREDRCKKHGGSQ